MRLGRSERGGWVRQGRRWRRAGSGREGEREREELGEAGKEREKGLGDAGKE